jgi:hypothetical protein
MMGSLLHRLTAIAALAAYLVVNLGAGALHHHHGTALGSEHASATPDTGPQFRSGDEDDDGDEEETCLLCSVLHLPQPLPCTTDAAVLIDLSGETLPAAPGLRPHLSPTPTRARAPPLA